MGVGGGVVGIEVGLGLGVSVLGEEPPPPPPEAAGVTPDDAALAGPVPTVFVAVTEKV